MVSDAPAAIAEPGKVVLIDLAYGLWPMLEYELDIAKRELVAGNQVVLLTCRGDVTACEANKLCGKTTMSKSRRRCVECVSRVDNGIAWLGPHADRVTVKSHRQLTPSQLSSIDTIMAQLDLRLDAVAIAACINIDGVDIFEAALSTLVSDIKVAKPDLVEHAVHFTFQIRTALENYYSSLNIIADTKPSQVYLYNGRFSKYRPMLRVANRLGIRIKTYEYPYLGFERYVTIDGDYPHNIKNTGKQIRQVIATSGAAEVAQIRTGHDLLTERVSGASQKEQPMIPTYNYWQTAGRLGTWSERDHNIVFFVSSEHEYCAIKEVTATHPYDQISAIQTILDNARKSVLHVRIHPNLHGRDPHFFDRLNALHGHDRLSIIPAKSSIDTYTLMKMADLVVSYGSTTGIEAAYLGKPVITVGTSFYEEFAATATTYTHAGLVRLLASAEAGDYAGFPEVAERHSEACKFWYAFVHFGQQPRYLSRQSYFGGFMIDQDDSKAIRPKRWIFVMNRLLDLPGKLAVGLRAMADPYKRNKVLSKPVETLIRKLMSIN